MTVDPATIKRKSAKAAGESHGASSLTARITQRAAALNAGKKTFTSSSALNALIGMPCPSLAFSYLIQCNVIPFSRAGQIVGVEGSGKSALLASLMYGIIELMGDQPIPGSVLYNDNEPMKSSLPLFKAIFENRRDIDSVVNVATTRLMEEWQSATTRKTDEWEDMYDPIVGKDKFGWCVPLAIGTDSLMSTCCRETLGKIRDAGHASRGFPAEANLLATYARTLSYQVSGRPILYLVTNHLKPFTDPDTGLPRRNIPGGQAFKFMESFEIQLDRVKDIKTNNRGGWISRIKAYKNCVGESRRTIEAAFVWEFGEDPETGERRQYAMWDWQGASIKLIQMLKAKDKKRWDAVNDVVDIHDGRNQSLVWSNTLGASSADQVSPHELGCRLEERPELLDAIYPILDIHRGRFFRLGMDYQAMLQQEHAQPDPQSDRVFRRPACGNLGRSLALGELDLSDAALAVDCESA